MAKTLKVLAIDGGGIRGVIPATILSAIEQRTGARIANLFDLVAGTSTGGILALGLVKPSDADGSKPQYTAANLVDLYAQNGKKIFQRSLWHRVVGAQGLLEEKYDAAGLESVLDKYFGKVMLSKAVTETLVTSYELETREPWFFARHKARDESKPGWDFPMKFVARATSAAPTYFEPEKLAAGKLHGGLVDGGVFANNPAMCAYVETMDLNPRARDVLVVSLGTGEHTRPIHYEDAKNWGLAMWAKPILNVVFDGVSDTVDHQMQILCKDAGDEPRYYRFQTELDVGSDDLDDATATNIMVLKQKAEELIKTESTRLDRLCKALTA